MEVVEEQVICLDVGEEVKERRDQIASSLLLARGCDGRWIE